MLFSVRVPSLKMESNSISHNFTNPVGVCKLELSVLKYV